MKNWILLIFILSNICSCRGQEHKKTNPVSKSGPVKLSHYTNSTLIISDILQLRGLTKSKLKDTVLIQGNSIKDTLFDQPKKILQYFMSVESQDEYDRLFGKNEDNEIPRKYLMGRYFDYEIMKITKALKVIKDSTQYQLFNVSLQNNIVKSSLDTTIIIATKFILNERGRPQSTDKSKFKMIKDPPEFLSMYSKFLSIIDKDVYYILFNAPIKDIENKVIREVALYTRTPGRRIFDVFRFFELIDHWQTTSETKKLSKIITL